MDGETLEEGKNSGDISGGWWRTVGHLKGPFEFALEITIGGGERK
jgi:hypothetical protein